MYAELATKLLEQTTIVFPRVIGSVVYQVTITFQNTPCEMDPQKCSLLIIYGSQTGQSKSIAEDIKTKAETHNYDVEMMPMDDSVEKVFTCFLSS